MDRILYEDNHLLALCKCAGDLVQGDASGDRTLLEEAKDYLREKYAKPGEVFLGVVHRLDRPVSGVVLYARTSKAAARLSEQFRRRDLEKIYWAVVEGRPPREADELEHLLSGGDSRTRVSVRRDGGSGKLARLRYRLLETAGERSLVEVRLLTGYKHQIRVQLAAIGCPVVGDFKYDNRQRPARPESLGDGRAIALHHRSLTIEHPTRREPLILQAPLPDYWPFVGSCG